VVSPPIIGILCQNHSLGPFFEIQVFLPSRSEFESVFAVRGSINRGGKESLWQGEMYQFAEIAAIGVWELNRT
jgi:hypothetical protein